jgi:anthranilate 1,2-dioxygenase small subunit/terephthalate 1,2-dioxygenase oxygenase component beta subunit
MDLLTLASFNAAYAEAIDSDALEAWPGFFTPACHYAITTLENRRAGLAAGIMYADSRNMLEDRVAALRRANIYERHTYRHIVGLPVLAKADDPACTSRTPFLVVRIMASGETTIFATGSYEDRFAQVDGALLLASRVAVCDSRATDTLLALPL